MARVASKLSTASQTRHHTVRQTMALMSMEPKPRERTVMTTVSTSPSPPRTIPAMRWVKRQAWTLPMP